MKLLQPPLTHYTDHYDLSKFRLVWNFCIALIFLLSALTIYNISNTNYSNTPNIVAVGIALIVLFIQYKTKRFEVISMFASIGCLVLISSVFFLIDNVLHYTTPFWMLINILFTFFTLGKRWGIPVMIAHFVVLFFYFGLRLEDNINRLEPYDTKDVTNFIIECAIVGLGIGYLLLQFIQSNKHAETELKKTNEALQRQNEIISKQNYEKEVMLKEIHHRVKNNLQVITSLLRLQARELEGDEKQNFFSEAINRIKSMALIHERMYQSDTLSNFNLKIYLESLINELVDSYSVEKPISLEVNSKMDELSPDAIVPISILFNELISNSIKHGFEHLEAGSIKVTMSPSERIGFVQLRYHDNGKWKTEMKNSFGLELIEIMTEQLDGSFQTQKCDDGTSYLFELKAANKA